MKTDETFAFLYPDLLNTLTCYVDDSSLGAGASGKSELRFTQPCLADSVCMFKYVLPLIEYKN